MTTIRLRRANRRRFPYGVFYRRRESDWLVVAVIHHARHLVGVEILRVEERGYHVDRQPPPG